MGCPACSQPLPDGARFCPSCGTALAQQNAAENVTDEERRVVTVLFADIVSFTALAEHRDPEQIKRLMDSAFALLVADVEAHGGRVDKVLGDAIIALFGAPVAHEDDADRAVRAGLAMQATLRDFRDRHPSDALRIRIGINTGEVLVGTLAGTDYTAMGDVVNTASRLQQLAPPGAVLVGDATRALCAATLRFRTFDEVQLRGRDQHEQVWQAIAHDSAVMTRRWQSDVEFVGRATELGVLRNLASIAVGGRCATLAVSGEPGIGKSRLVHEVVAAVIASQPDTFVLEGVCAPYGESNPLWPLAGGLLARLGLDRNATPEEARRRVVRRLEPFQEFAPGSQEFNQVVEVVMHLLGHPSGLDALSPAATREAVIAGLTIGLKRRASQSPLVVWIDDLQWAAPLLLEMLESMARQMADLPVLIATTYRRSEDGLSDWPAATESALTLHLPLAPLLDDEAAELVAIAADRQLPEKTVRSISGRAGGNPLFLTELARLAAACPDDPHTLELPGSLRALIAARIDQLSASQRALLDNASILGVEGRLTSLREFATELGQPYEDDDIDVLDGLGLVVRDGQRWRFRSDVVREVAYGTLTKQARAQRHAGVARHMATTKEPMIERRAHHLASAAELVAEIGPTAGVGADIAAQAIEALVQASRRSYHHGAYRQGLQLLDRAFALDPDPRMRLDATLMSAELLVETRARTRARDAITDIFELAAVIDDRVARAEAFRLRGMLSQMDGDLVAARRDLGHAVAEFRELSDEKHLGEALRARGFAEVFGGSLNDAEWFLGEADAIYERIGNVRGRAWVQQHLAWVSFLSGDHDLSNRRLDAAIATFEQVGDRGGVSWSKGLMAYVRHFSRQNAEAEQLASSVYEEARRWGDEWGASMMLNLRASIRLWAGDIELARTLSDKSLAGFRRIEDQFGTVQALSTLNRALVASGRSVDAERSVEEILALGEAFGQLAFPSMSAAGTAMHAGNGRRAAELAERALSHLDTSGANNDEGRVVLAFGHALSGEPEVALGELLAVDVGSSPFALAARATASAMIGDVATALADVAAVEALAAQPDSNVSYWDRWVARIAGVALIDGESPSALTTLREDCESLGDVVVRAYAFEVLRQLGALEGEHPSYGAHALRGWRDVAAAITSHRRAA